MDTSSPSCNEYITGTIHEGQAQGVKEVLHRLKTYIIGKRTSPKAIVVIYSNIFDLSLPKIIADTYAQNDNYLACLLDFFQGDSVKLKVAGLLRTYAIRAGLESDMIENDGKKMTLIDAVFGLHPGHLVVPGDGEKSVVPVSSGGLKKIP